MGKGAKFTLIKAAWEIWNRYNLELPITELLCLQLQLVGVRQLWVVAQMQCFMDSHLRATFLQL